MKKIIFVLLLFLDSIWIYSIEVRMRDGVSESPKYTFNGKPIWNDAEKQKLIDSHASTINTGTGTYTLKDSDFIPYSIDSLDQAIFDDIKLEGKKFTYTEFQEELGKRKSEDYQLEKMREEKSKIDFKKSFSISTGTEQDQYNKYLDRYNQVKK